MYHRWGPQSSPNMLGGFGGMPPPPHENCLKANPAFWAYLKKVELAKKECIFLLLFYKKWFESNLHLILLTKFDLLISNSLNQIHNEKISFTHWPEQLYPKIVTHFKNIILHLPSSVSLSHGLSFSHSVE